MAFKNSTANVPLSSPEWLLLQKLGQELDDLSDGEALQVGLLEGAVGVLVPVDPTLAKLGASLGNMKSFLTRELAKTRLTQPNIRREQYSIWRCNIQFRK